MPHDDPELKKMNTRALEDKLSNDVFYVKQILDNHIKPYKDRPLQADDKKELKGLLHEIADIDKIMRGRIEKGSNVYDREEKDTLVEIINVLHKNKVGIDDKSFGKEIQYLQAQGVKPPSKDQGRGG